MFNSFSRISKRAWQKLALLTTLVMPLSGAFAGNFYPGINPGNVPWPGGIVPYEFTNTLSQAMQQTYLDGLREWELAANVHFVPHSNQVRYILFAYNTNGYDNVSTGYSPQVVSVSSLSRSQVAHEMGHSFGFTHENIRPDAASFVTVLTNNIYPSSNLIWFTIDPNSVTNGPYDFESVMHLSANFSSVDPDYLYTQQPRPGYERYQTRMGNFAISPGDRASLRFLYGPPVVPLTNVVTTTVDAGPGSLRAAMYYTADNPGVTVRFNLPTNDPGFSNGVFTIHLSSHLPPLATNGMVIDGSTQPGFAGRPLVVVDGSLILPETFTSMSGLLVYSANNQIKNLSFHGFNWNGLTFLHADATNNTVTGCWLGLDASGSNAAPNTYQGILVADGASHNTIGGTNAGQRNVISGNLQYGVLFTDPNTSSNTVLGSYLGTDATGSNAVPNGKSGVGIIAQATYNTVGTPAPGGGNLLSGNTEYGVAITDPGTTGNSVQGNLVGTDASGRTALPNATGVGVFAGAQDNLVGGATPAAGNVFSGNATYGLLLADPGTSGNQVQGNFIGTDGSGSNAVPNQYSGVLIAGGTANNTLGGASPNARNVISGNINAGIFLTDSATDGNLIEGNFVGTDASGTAALGNTFVGVYVLSSAQGNVIGGATAGAGNVISGNGSYGLYLRGTNTSANLVQGNLVGTSANGSNAVPNGFIGIIIFDGASDNVVGLDLAGVGAGNRVAYNFGEGIRVEDSSATGNVIRGNSIYSNSGIGINLLGGNEGPGGVTTNDLNDADSGPNNLQNYPAIGSATVSGSLGTVTGTLNSTPGHSFLLDFYANAAPDPTGFGDGQFYLGSTNVTAGLDGNANFRFLYPGAVSNEYPTATATDAGSGDTSEFSAAVPSTSVPPPSLTGPFSFSISAGFVLNATLTSGQSYRIQASTNLNRATNWMDLTNFTATSANLRFTNSAATNLPLRFYRIVSP